jgi:hypothetical protein
MKFHEIAGSLSRVARDAGDNEIVEMMSSALAGGPNMIPVAIFRQRLGGKPFPAMETMAAVQFERALQCFARAQFTRVAGDAIERMRMWTDANEAYAVIRLQAKRMCRDHALKRCHCGIIRRRFLQRLNRSSGLKEAGFPLSRE